MDVAQCYLSGSLNLQNIHLYGIQIYNLNCIPCSIFRIFQTGNPAFYLNIHIFTINKQFRIQIENKVKKQNLEANPKIKNSLRSCETYAKSKIYKHVQTTQYIKHTRHPTHNTSNT